MTMPFQHDLSQRHESQDHGHISTGAHVEKHMTTVRINQTDNRRTMGVIVNERTNLFRNYRTAVRMRVRPQ